MTDTQYKLDIHNTDSRIERSLETLKKNKYASKELFKKFDRFFELARLGKLGQKSGNHRILSYIYNLNKLLNFFKKDLDKLTESELEKFYYEKEKKKIKTRLIYNNEFRDVLELYKNLKLTEVRFIEKITPSTIVITKGKVLIISYGEDPRQVLIKSTPISESFYDFFESMWKLAKK